MIANSDNMSKIQKALFAVYEQKAVTQTTIAKRLKCSQSFVSEMLTGDKHMNDDAIEGFCDALGVKLSELENWNPDLGEGILGPGKHAGSIAYTCANKAHAKYHRMLDTILDGTKKEWKTGIIANLKGMSSSASADSFGRFPISKSTTPKPLQLVGHDPPQPARFVKVPYYERIPAGDPVQLAFDQSLWMDIVHTSAKPGWWTTRVWGDSMLPEYRDGDIVLMDHDQTPQPGNIVAALIDGSEATLKVFEREGDEIILTPLNKQFELRRFHASRVQIQGVLIELVRRPPPARRTLRRKNK